MTDHYAKSSEAKAIEAAKMGATLGKEFIDSPPSDNKCKP